MNCGTKIQTAGYQGQRCRAPSWAWYRCLMADTCTLLEELNSSKSFRALVLGFNPSAQAEFSDMIPSTTTGSSLIRCPSARTRVLRQPLGDLAAVLRQEPRIGGMQLHSAMHLSRVAISSWLEAHLRSPPPPWSRLNCRPMCIFSIEFPQDGWAVLGLMIPIWPKCLACMRR